ncbi:protocadherin-12-like [Scleropages formosus]|uniref:Protocadherin-12-like n=1 Tax=Scleropages formosus TaxID=113540 RepID=A0A0P7V6F9_SCLFO|nr:protocadherin-12-like [Scleropages formosus]
MLLILLLCLLPGTLSQDPGAPTTIHYQVLEEQPAGTKVGRILEDLQKHGQSGALEDFRVVEHGHALPFTVREGDGLVTTLGQLDREALCSGSDLCEILFNVLYRQAGSIQFLRVVVEVKDLNDHSPAFPNAEQEVEISESASLHMRIPLDQAMDPDAGPNGLQTYSLSTNQHFALDVKSPSTGGKQAELVVIKVLDREAKSSFELTLVAWDKGNPPRSGSTLIKINVLDSNDNSPVFEDNAPSIELGEDSPRGTVVINLKATDPDQGANGQIEYSLSKHSPLDVQKLFSVNPQTGTVTLIGLLDYEEKRSYEVDIQAKDMGPSPIPSHCKLHIKVKDINDNAPRIHVTWTDPSSSVATVAEGAADETFLALVVVSDADSGLNGEVHVRIQHGGGHFRLKRLHRDNYMIVTNGTLDREKQMDYNLTVVAQDRGVRPLSCITHLTVHVLDENDNAPVFLKSLYTASFKENNPLGLHVLTVQAHDVDLDLSGEITYSIQDSNELGTSTVSFSIHPITGEVFAQQSLDYEESSTFSFVVEASDHGQPPLTGSTTVQIYIQDVNDNAPVIEDPQTKKGKALVIVPINAEKGEIVTELGDRLENHLFSGPSSNEGNHSTFSTPEGFLATTIKARDLDSGLNGQLRFTITKTNAVGLFLLDDLTGQLYVNTSNATELIGKTFEIDITVTDMGTPALYTSAALEITFINKLDHLKNSSPGQWGQLTFTMMLAICLGVTCLLLLLAAALVTTFCRPEKRDNRAYNCRQAESSYTRHPRRPQKQIQKADIQLVPVLRGRREDRSANEAQPLTSLTPEPEEPLCCANFNSAVLHQGLPEDQATLPLSQLKALNKPSSVELDRTLPRTPGTLYRTLRRTRQSESSTSLSQTDTMKRYGCPEAQTESEEPSRTLRRQKNSESGRGLESEDHRQLLRNLVRLSMAAFGENSAIELSSASPEVQQVSQLLSLLHQGQLQPRPNFRGNKYSHRGGRSAVQDADWLSTKDSGHGESEAGDVDWDTGRDSPVDHLLEEGLDTLLSNTDEVFSDVSDPAWMARLSLPLTTDYHENVFVPEGPPSPAPWAPQTDGNQSTGFSTFGKTAEKGSPLGGALLSEVSTLFEMLLTQKADAQPRTSAQLLYRLSAAYRRSMGLDGTAAGGSSPGRYPAGERSPAVQHSGTADPEKQQLI